VALLAVLVGILLRLAPQQLRVLRVQVVLPELGLKRPSVLWLLLRVQQLLLRLLPLAVVLVVLTLQLLAN
jgi:hypothetical protein